MSTKAQPGGGLVLRQRIATLSDAAGACSGGRSGLEPQVQSSGGRNVRPSTGCTLHEAVDCRIEEDELTKPGVALTLFATPTEMMLSIRSLVPLQPLLFSLPGIGLAAAAGSRSNHLVDRCLLEPYAGVRFPHPRPRSSGNNGVGPGRRV
jgi:hypothetical protein